jgi:hypothetical protein
MFPDFVENVRNRKPKSLLSVVNLQFNSPKDNKVTDNYMRLYDEPNQYMYSIFEMPPPNAKYIIGVDATSSLDKSNYNLTIFKRHVDNSMEHINRRVKELMVLSALYEMKKPKKPTRLPRKKKKLMKKNKSKFV